MISRKMTAKERRNNSNNVPLLTGRFYLDDSMCAKMEFDNACSNYIDKGNGLLNNFVGTILIKRFGLSITLCSLIIFALYLVIYSFSMEFLAVLSVILCVLTSLIVLLKIIFIYFVEPRILLESIKATSCYKGIIERIRESNLSEIKYIYSNKSRVVLCDNADNTINIYFKRFDFPNLSIDKQPLLIAGIINDICESEKKNFKITNKFRAAGLKSYECEAENYTYGKENYSFENLFVATNKKLMN